MADTDTTDQQKSKAGLSFTFSSWEIVVGVFLTIAAVYYVLPTLFVTIKNKGIAAILIILLAPLVRVTVDFLYNEKKAGSLSLFFASYLMRLFSMVFELTLLCFFLPMIALPLCTIVAALLFVALSIFGIIGLLQLFLHIPLGRPIAYQELAELFHWWAALGVGTIILLMLFRLWNIHNQVFFDKVACIHDMGIQKIKNLLEH